MADQPQNEPATAGNEFPPVQPTETFKPLNYMPPPQTPGSVEQTPHTYSAPQSSYTPSPGQFAPPYSAPVQKKRGRGILVWVLGGCGVIAVLGFIALAVIVKNVTDQVGKSGLVKNMASLPTARQNLVEIRAGVDKYRQAHGGKFPATLSGVVDPSYLTYMSNNGNVKVEYMAPAQNTAEDAVIARFYVGQINMSMGQALDSTSLILLKNGTTMLEQVVRTPDKTR